MTNYLAFATDLDAETVARIPVGNIGMIDVHTAARALNAAAAHRPRIYAYLERGECAGQIVSLKSLYDLERFEGLLGFAWTSANTLADLVSPARH